MTTAGIIVTVFAVITGWIARRISNSASEDMARRKRNRLQWAMEMDVDLDSAERIAGNLNRVGFFCWLWSVICLCWVVGYIAAQIIGGGAQ